MPKTWFVVSQVKSHRVVYYTDDPEYQPPTDGDWYFVSCYAGDLPAGMTLRNCWGWRFNGSEFTDARAKAAPQKAQALLAHNREALHKLLREKIDLARRPLAASSLLGETLRNRKLAEAQALLNAGAPASSLRLLPAIAAARGVPLREMAARIVELHTRQEDALVASEALREELAAAIDAASSQEELTALRNRLLEEVTPEASVGYAIEPKDLTPAQKDAKPSAQELTQERLRLQVQLRLKINELRRPYVSHYLLDDVVLRHKGKVAQLVVARGGQVPDGVDAMPLISHAAGRNLTLAQAAHEVLSEMNESARVLLQTEQLKDEVLSLIAKAQTFGELKDAGNAIRQLSTQAAAQA